MLTEISIVKDQCNNSFSAIAKIRVADYLSIVNGITQLDAQRDVLRTSTAVKIRNRMIDDIIKGTVIPPIVLGVILPDGINELTNDNTNQIIQTAHETLTIIDGIQRTESLRKAVLANQSVGNMVIRVEIWASHNVTSLIYRMLVLNTGQVPWNTRRQVEVVYAPLKAEAERKVDGLHLMSLSENGRRSAPGEYPASVIADLYMAFTSRKALFDNKEGLADDFTRLDVIDATGRLTASDYFFDALRMMVQLDQQFFRCDVPLGTLTGKIHSGRDIFTSGPSRVAFMVAIAVYISGRAGSPERPLTEQDRRMRNIRQHFDNLIQRLTVMSDDELSQYLCIPVLNEMVEALPTKRIGDEERKYFTDAYTLLVKELFELETLEEAWRA